MSRRTSLLLVLAGAVAVIAIVWFGGHALWHWILVMHGRA